MYVPFINIRRQTPVSSGGFIQFFQIFSTQILMMNFLNSKILEIKLNHHHFYLVFWNDKALLALFQIQFLNFEVMPILNQ